MAHYVDGFVLPIPKKNVPAYRKISAKAGKIWKEHGALSYKEAVADDVDVEGIKVTFPKLAKVKKGEVVVFSYILYKSRAHRDKVNEKVMADPRLHTMMDPKSSPFDMKRMSYGGFTTIVDL